MTSALTFRLLLVLIVLTATLFLVDHFGINPDNSWQFIAAERLLDYHGYCCEHLVELNPPLATYITTVAVLLHRVFSFSPLASHTGLTLGLISLSLILSRSVIETSGLPPDRQYRILLTLCVLFLLLPGTMFGERDHWLIILVLPYLLSFASRAGKPLRSNLIPIVIGATAGIGFSLKPQTLVVVAALEITLAAKSGKWTAILSPYLYSLLSTVTIYVILLLTFNKEYLAIVPTIYRVYGYIGWPAIYNYALFGIAIVALALALRLTHRAALHDGSMEIGFVFYLLLASLVFAIIAFVQNKGWPYYYLPTLTLSSFSILMLLPLAEHTRATFLACIAVAFAVATMFYRPHPASKQQRQIEAYLAHSGRASVMFLDADIASAYPAVLNSGLSPVGRSPFLWWLPATRTRANKLSDAQAEDILRYWDNTVIADINSGKPDIIFTREKGEYLSHFLAYERFRRVFRAYCESTEVADEFIAFLRCTPDPSSK